MNDTNTTNQTLAFTGIQSKSMLCTEESTMNKINTVELKSINT
jgi:hypothetical protein